MRFGTRPCQTFSRCFDELGLLHEVAHVVGSDLHIVDIDALLAGGIGSSAQQLLHFGDGAGGLAVGVVQDGSGHVAVADFVQGGVQPFPYGLHIIVAN